MSLPRELEMLLLLSVLLALVDVLTGTMSCDYKGYKDISHRSDESMEWFNTFFESWLVDWGTVIQLVTFEELQLKLVNMARFILSPSFARC